uniref:Uncharacterized protein AlNc14C302G10391 n=1 Tax=Albugo laibachii Nc14 TaxID=890382 RepID=F0W1S8_9STRA|nr:conserved hypothetical protein [Albugo laibachii Nc14]CCA25498.1 conserved hypothetical protein [Albugo laibachii Nc14]|eukprot:CCA25498.1 conserved hypothetical protein [Albugo laibachii Nc14]
MAAARDRYISSSTAGNNSAPLGTRTNRTLHSQLMQPSASNTTQRAKFPLPPNYFSNIKLTPAQEKLSQAERNRSLEEAFQREHTFLSGGRKHLRRWKHIKRKGDLDFYVSTHKTPEERFDRSSSSPVIVAVGTVQSTVEDLVYGDYTPTDAEYMQRIAYVNASSVRDARVVYTVEHPQGTPYTNDRFRSLCIKWCLARIPVPGADLLVKQRDLVYYESVGLLQVSPHERGPTLTETAKIGYLIIRPCELAQIPQFSSAFRGRMAIICIYRQIQPNVVQIFSETALKLEGGIGHKFAFHVNVSLSSRVFDLIQYVEGKKLAAATSEAESSSLKKERESGHEVSGNSCMRCHNSFKRNLMGMLQYRTCYICELIVCHHCCLRKRMIGKKVQGKYWCCIRCISTTKLHVFGVEADPNTSVVLNTPMPDSSSPVESDVVISDFETTEEDASRYFENTVKYTVLDNVEKVEADTNSKVENEDEGSDDLAQSFQNLLSLSPSENDDEGQFNGDQSASRVNDVDVELEIDTTTLRAASEVSNNDTRVLESPRIPYLANNRSVSSYQTGLYHQMLSLRRAAETAYELTQANQQAMNLS